MTIRKYQILLFIMSMLFGAAATVAVREYLERKWFQGLCGEMSKSIQYFLDQTREELGD